MHHDARVIGVWKKMWYDTYTIRRAEAISDRQEQERTMNQHKQFFQRLGAAAFWLAVWQCAAMAVGQEVFLVSPVQAVRTLLQLLPQAEFWQRVGFSSGRILLGFGLGVAVSIVLAVAAQAWHTADVLLAPVLQLVKATPVASFIILALVWVRGASLSVLISFLMVLPVALGICWKSGVAAEVIGLPNGSIGDALYRAKITLSTGELFAWTFVIILLSAGFEKLFLLLLDRVTRAVTGEVPQC